MTVYYASRCARVTDEIFESRWPVSRRFPLSELRCPHTVHDTAIRQVAASTQVQVCSSGTFALSIMAAVVGWPVFDMPAITAFGALAAALVAGLVMVARYQRRRPMEIRAVFRGELVCLYRSTNRFVWGQVRRALLRALERLEDTGSAGEASAGTGRCPAG